jgi:hypothetical protein
MRRVLGGVEEARVVLAKAKQRIDGEAYREGPRSVTGC